MLGLGFGLVLGLFSALLDMFRTRSPMFDTLQRRNNSHCLHINDGTKTLRATETRTKTVKILSQDNSVS